METIGYQEVPDRRSEGERRSDPDDVEAIALGGLQGAGGHRLERTPSVPAPGPQAIAGFEFPPELNIARSGDTLLKPALGPDHPNLQGLA